MKINQVIKNERVKRGWTQDELAKELNISRQSISKWESGVSIPTTEQLIKISELFDMTLDRLVKGEDIPMNAEKREKIKIRLLKNNKKVHFLFFSGWGIIVSILYIMKYVLHIF